MAVAAEAEQLDVDAAGGDDPILVGAALGVEIWRGAVGDVGAGEVDVDVPEKIFLHEKPIRLRVRRGQPDVFVEVERGDAAEIEALGPVEPDEFLIEPERRATGGEAEDGVRFFADDAGDDFGTEHATDLGGIADEDFHGEDEQTARGGRGRQRFNLFVGQPQSPPQPGFFFFASARHTSQPAASATRARATMD